MEAVIASKLLCFASYVRPSGQSEKNTFHRETFQIATWGPRLFSTLLCLSQTWCVTATLHLENGHCSGSKNAGFGVGLRLTFIYVLVTIRQNKKKISKEMKGTSLLYICYYCKLQVNLTIILSQTM